MQTTRRSSTKKTTEFEQEERVPCILQLSRLLTSLQKSSLHLALTSLLQSKKNPVNPPEYLYSNPNCKLMRLNAQSFVSPSSLQLEKIRVWCIRASGRCTKLIHYCSSSRPLMCVRETDRHRDSVRERERVIRKNLLLIVHLGFGNYFLCELRILLLCCCWWATWELVFYPFSPSFSGVSV